MDELYYTRKPIQQDFQDCQLAVSNMDTIDDIDPTQLPAIFGIFSFLTSQQDDDGLNNVAPGIKTQ